jgi:hypothetical protein
MTCTTFHNAIEIVYSPSRTPDMLRTTERNVEIGNCRIMNRSNYTRVMFAHERTSAYIAPLGHQYSMRVFATPKTGAIVNVRGLTDTNVVLALSAAEMRSIAYMMLAAANSIDGVDTDRNQKTRKPGFKHDPSLRGL